MKRKLLPHVHTHSGVNQLLGQWVCQSVQSFHTQRSNVPSNGFSDFITDTCNDCSVTLASLYHCTKSFFFSPAFPVISYDVTIHYLEDKYMCSSTAWSGYQVLHVYLFPGRKKPGNEPPRALHFVVCTPPHESPTCSIYRYAICTVQLEDSYYWEMAGEFLTKPMCKVIHPIYNYLGYSCRPTGF